MAIRVGSIVEWDGGGANPTMGRVTRISPNRPIDVPGADFRQTPGEDDPAVLMRVVRENDDGELEDTDTYVGRRLSRLRETNRKSWFRKTAANLRDTFRNEPPPLKQAGFKALGDGIWVAAYTNNFIDKHGEIISQAAHDRYIARLKAGFVDYPELWLWHTKGTRHGQALSVERYGHMVIAIGTFDDTPAGRAAEAHYRKANEPLQLSHGFYHPVTDPDDEGVYHDINTFEISVLPSGTAANPFTSFQTINKETEVKENQRKFIAAVLGDDAAKKIAESVKNIQDAGDTIEKAGESYKDFADLTPEDETEKTVADKPTDETLDALGAKFGELFTQLFEAQAYLADETAIIAKAVKGLGGKLTSAVDTLQAQTKAFETTLKQLKSEVELAPRAVEDVETNVTDNEAAAVKETTDKQANVEYDPFWGDMKVPKENS